MEVRVEVGKLVRQNVRVRNNVERLFAETLLHLDHIFAQTILSCQLVRAREVIDLLELIHLIVHETFDALRRPQHVPLVAFGLPEAICLHNGLDKLSIGFHHFEKHVELRLLVLARLRVA